MCNELSCASRLRKNITRELHMKIVVYDSTDYGIPGWSWAIGAYLFRALGRFDLVIDTNSWDDALSQLIYAGTKEKITEIQFWGHGNPGNAFVNKESLFQTKNYLELLGKLSECLAPDCLFWFRTCGTFAGYAGANFAMNVSQLLNCRAAGSTHLIALYHSGQHSVRPHEEPSWSRDEGLDSSGGMLQSNSEAPNTIKFIQMSLPSEW